MILPSSLCLSLRHLSLRKLGVRSSHCADASGVLQFFQRAEFESARALADVQHVRRELVKSLDKGMLYGHNDRREMIHVTVNKQPVESSGYVFQLPKATKGVVMAEYDGSHATMLQLLHKNKVVQQVTAWPGEPVQVSPTPAVASIWFVSHVTL